ncbi:ExeA family protein [Jannaschia seohaensis]|nr:AAA family ATPase [Jannaschia seohaensis]
MSGSTYFASHFGLRERPFTLLPDPDFIYWSPAHKRAFTVLEYGVFTCAPITVITGEVGAGKTTLLQRLLQDLGEQVVVGLVSNAQGGRGDLLHWVLNALGLDVGHETAYVTKFQILQDFIIEQYAAERRVLLIIDEAQNLSMEGLEELRMLTNINSGKDELLQLILVGQPELRDMISRPELRQFAQRVTASFHVPAMDLETTRAYIRHRLTHAGGTGGEFSDAAIGVVHEGSGGVPRLVNKLCDFAMAYAMSSERATVEADTVRDVLADDMFITTRAPAPAPTPLRLDRKIME